MAKPSVSSLLRVKPKKQSIKAGLPPGTVVYLGKDRSQKPVISATTYTGLDEPLEETTNLSIPQLQEFPKEAHTAWINIDGIHEVELIKAVGLHFGLHPLTQEDIANTEQRPKSEEFEDYLFVLIKMISYDHNLETINIEQVSLVLTQHVVITFQEETEDVFDPLRERLRVPGTRLRRHEADYLLFALLDVVVSNYFYVVEQLNEALVKLEAEIVKGIDQEALQDMQRYRNSLQAMEKAIFPLREVVSYIMRCDSHLLQSQTRMYFQELQDQVHQVSDAITSFRDSLNNLQNLYLALASQKTNEVMKVLTVFSTIFLPLSFLTGIYGMNFEVMPELHWEQGYYVLWGFNLLLILGMLIYFRMKEWW
ncbi:MAG: magnesium/cobalt transporter CorA [Bacteroidota bacterium]